MPNSLAICAVIELPPIGMLRMNARLWSEIISEETLPPMLSSSTHSSLPTCCAALAALKSATGAMSTDNTLRPEFSMTSVYLVISSVFIATKSASYSERSTVTSSVVPSSLVSVVFSCHWWWIS